MRLRVLLACAVLPCVLWAVLPVSSTGQGQLQQRIDAAREAIERKKGTERVLTSDIAAYTAKIRRLQARIGGLQRRQASLQTDLDRKRAELVRIQVRLRPDRARLARLRARLVVPRRSLARQLPPQCN